MPDNLDLKYSVRLMLWSGYYGIWPYIARLGSMLQAPKGDFTAQVSNKILRFKQTGKHSDEIKLLIIAIAKHLECDSILVIPLPLLLDNYEITENSKIIFVKTDNQSLNYYKNLFLKKGIDYTTGLLPLFVLIDGYLFGFLLFDVIRYGMDQEKSTRGVYLLSDFIIANPVKRLSKLLLLSIKTKELQQILKSHLIRPVDFILTTAFTDKPISMKYRGVFKLLKRGKGFLQYTTECGVITAKEALGTWIRKYKER